MHPSMMKFINTISYKPLVGIYISHLGTLGNRNELIRFWGQKGKKLQLDQNWLTTTTL